MPHISSKKLKKETLNRLYGEFGKAFEKSARKSGTKLFLGNLLTRTEKIMLAKRISIAVLLAKGYSYPSIRQMLRVTPSTISNVSLNLKYSDKGYRKIVEKILRDEKMNEFWQKIETKLTDVPPLKGHDWSYWRKEHEYKKRKNKKPF